MSTPNYPDRQAQLVRLMLMLMILGASPGRGLVSMGCEKLT
jgi:hypothetical protein